MLASKPGRISSWAEPIRPGRLCTGRRESGAECGDTPGRLRYERFGGNVTVAVDSLSHLSLCHAQLGPFTEGRAMAEKKDSGSPRRSIIPQPDSGVLWGRSRVSAPRERAPGHPSARAGYRAVPRPTYCALLAQPGWCPGCKLSWMAVRFGSGLVEQGVAQEVAPEGRLRRLAPLVAWLSEASLLAGRLEDAYTRAAQAVSSPASTSNAAIKPGRYGSWVRARRARHPQRSRQLLTTTARLSPWLMSWV